MTPIIAIKTLSRTRLLAGAERIPVISAMMLSAIVVIAGFGVTPSGVIVGITMFAGLMKILRDIAKYDPLYFQILWKRWAPLRLPLRLPKRETVFNPSFWRKNAV
jgi:type IV secretory pathway TrbD component